MNSVTNSSKLKVLEDKEMNQTLLEKLLPEELETLLEIIKELLGVKLQATATAHEIIEIENPIKECPICKGSYIIKHGHRRGVQRYLCKECKHTFGATNATFLYKTQLSYETWINFIMCEILHMTLLETANQIGVQKTSCFHMRHRLYGACEKLKKKQD